MGGAWYPGVDITVEVSLPTVTTGFGVWDTATWDTATWGPDEQWTDISAWVRTIEIDRRFARYLQVWDAGSATVTLNNPGGRFSATNTTPGAPYVIGGRSMIRPLLPLRITATHAGVTYPLFRGFTGPWKETPLSQTETIVTVPCQDVWGMLGSDGIAGLTPVGAGDSYGARVLRILAAAGYTGAVSADAGVHTMQATALSDRPIDELTMLAKSEGGGAAVWVDADGTIIADGQLTLVEDPRSSIAQAAFDDGQFGGVPCREIVLDWLTSQIRNLASFARVGGTPQVRDDPDSRALTQIDQRESETALACETDAQADLAASLFIAAHGADEQTVTALTLAPLDAAHGHLIWPQVFGRRIRDLAQVTKKQPSGTPITKYCHISGVHHSFGGDATTTFDLVSATVWQQFAASKWDIGTWGADPADSTAARWFY